MFRRWNETIFSVVCFCMVFSVFNGREAFSSDRAHAEKKDLNADGYPESVVYYGLDGLIEKIESDENGDRRVDTTVYYKHGFRDTAEKDTNHDGKPDTWVRYYFTGIPWVVARDRNADNKPDYWKYLKNGFVYKKERDRNLDGRADLKLIFDVKPDLRMVSEKPKPAEKQYDNDFDGVFEKTERIPVEAAEIKIENVAGSIIET